MNWPHHITREALDAWEAHTASPVLGWLMAHWRGWAWLHCSECGWWVVSLDRDLLPDWLEHVTDPTHETAV